MQGRGQEPRALFEGGQAGDEMCERPVRAFRRGGCAHSYRCTVVNSIAKMRENCLKEFDEHWNCLEINNQVRSSSRVERNVVGLTLQIERIGRGLGQR